MDGLACAVFPDSGWCTDGNRKLGEYLARRTEDDYKSPGTNGYAWNETSYWKIDTESSKRPYALLGLETFFIKKTKKRKAVRTVKEVFEDTPIYEHDASAYSVKIRGADSTRGDLGLYAPKQRMIKKGVLKSKHVWKSIPRTKRTKKNKNKLSLIYGTGGMLMDEIGQFETKWWKSDDISLVDKMRPYSDSIMASTFDTYELMQRVVELKSRRRNLLKRVKR